MDHRFIPVRFKEILKKLLFFRRICCKCKVYINGKAKKSIDFLNVYRYDDI